MFDFIWYLQSKDETITPLEISEDQARDILKQWRNNVNAELVGIKPDGSEYLKDVVNRNDCRIRKSNKQVESEEEKGERGWICDHEKWQPMSQGCYTNDQGKRDWKADCNCKNSKEISEKYRPSKQR